MLVEEHGKFYNVDEETGLVTVASDEDVANQQDLSDEFRIGDRVDVAGDLGEVVSVIPSVYGAAFGVKFDDGSVDEFVESMLKRSTVEKPVYASPIEEVIERYSVYEQMDKYTNSELDRKESEARWLNLRAKSLVSNPQLPMEARNQLSAIALVTSSDMEGIKELREESPDTQAYVSRFNRYSLSADVQSGGAVMGLQGDVSWLDGALEDMEVAETTDSDLATVATEVVTHYTAEQLGDDEFLKAVAAYQHEYLQMTDEQKVHFEGLITAARDARVKELPAIKQASVEDFDNYDDASLFL